MIGGVPLQYPPSLIQRQSVLLRTFKEPSEHKKIGEKEETKCGANNIDGKGANHMVKDCTHKGRACLHAYLYINVVCR